MGWGGLISGSTAADLVTVLTAICSRYAMANWSVMKKELPGLTDEDILWLSSMTQAMGQQTRLEGGLPRRSSTTKSKGGSDSQEGPTVHRDKRPGSKRPGTWSTAKKDRARSRGARLAAAVGSTLPVH